MKILWALMLTGALVAGCASMTPAQVANPSGGNRGVASIATEGRVTEEASTEVARLPVMTANPTPFILTSIPGNNVVTSVALTTTSTEGWQTFTIPALGVAINYPPDLSLSEQADGAIFTAPSGVTILLSISKANNVRNDFKIVNQRCSSRPNAYNLTADVCVETVTFSYSAKFAITMQDKSNQWLTLTTNTRATTDVFGKMFNSLHSVAK